MVKYITSVEWCEASHLTPVSIFPPTAQAVVSDDIPFAELPIALRLTLTDGSQLIMGTSTRPFPLTTVTTKRPDKSSEQSAQTLTSTWTAPSPALEVVTV